MIRFAFPCSWSQHDCVAAVDLKSSNLWQRFVSAPCRALLAHMALTQSVKDTIKGYLKQAEDGGHVAAMAGLFQYLKSMRLMHSQKVQPDLVHVHPANRDGIGVYPTEVHTLLSDIGDAGWSWAEVRPIAVEVASGDLKIQEFNEQLVVSSGGLLPPVQAGTVKMASLSATHTNMVLRLFASASQHVDERFTTGGRLSKEKLKEHDVEFWNAVDSGLTWDVIDHTVMEAFPELAGLVQLTANTSGQLQRRETELQLAKRIFCCWERKSSTHPSGCVSFEDVKKELMKSKPACGDSLAHLFRFAMQYGGGQRCSYLEETIRVCAACPPKMLGSDFWSAILTQPRCLPSAYHVLLRIYSPNG